MQGLHPTYNTFSCPDGPRSVSGKVTTAKVHNKTEYAIEPPAIRTKDAVVEFSKGDGKVSYSAGTS